MHVVCVVAFLLVVGHAARVNFHGEGGDHAARVSGQSEAESYAHGTARANSSSNLQKKEKWTADWLGPRMFVESECDGSSLVEVDSNGDLVQPDPPGNSSLAELQSSSAYITFQIKDSDVELEMKSDQLATKGSAKLSLTFNKDVRTHWGFKKTKVVLIGSVGALTLYATVGMDVTLDMTAPIGIQLDIPIDWNICASSSGKCGHVEVNMGSVSLKRWFRGKDATGSASFNVGILIEKAGVLATKVAAVSKLTLKAKTCTVRYDVQAKVKGLSTVTWLANKAVDFVNAATGYCLDEFDSPSLTDIVSRRVWSGGCGRDLR